MNPSPSTFGGIDREHNASLENDLLFNWDLIQKPVFIVRTRCQRKIVFYNLHTTFPTTLGYEYRGVSIKKICPVERGVVNSHDISIFMI